MSAGASVGKPDRDITKLAPKMQDAVFAMLDDCADAGLDVFVYEAYRSKELQELYYQRGRPPTTEYPRPVTNARSNLYSWHGYGLAVDCISRAHLWNRPVSWFEAMAQIAKQHGLKWGGDWKQKDYPHLQWGLCKASPSDLARTLFVRGGLPLVWQVVGAD